MADLDNVIGNLEGLTWDDWHEWHSDSEVTVIAQDAMALLKHQADEIEKLTRYINGFSCDAVPVVRCKDCKRRYEYRTGSCPYFTVYGSTAPENWFCADGKRKEE